MKSIIIILVLSINLLFAQSVLKNFSFTKNITISEEILLTRIKMFDVKNNKFLITDELAGEIYLINQSGKLIKQFTPVKEHPGLHWHPYFATFTKKNEIFVLNSIPWGVKFTDEGKLLKVLGTHFDAADKIISLSENNVSYCLHRFGNNFNFFLQLTDKDGYSIKKFGEFPQKNQVAISKIDNAGGICSDESDNIYHVNATDYKIIKYDKNGNKLSEFAKKPEFYRTMPEIGINTNPMKEIHETAILFRDYYITENIYYLGNNKIIILFRNSKYWSYQIYTTDGKFICEEKSPGFPTFIMAKNNKLYLSFAAEEDSEGNIPNPEFFIYKFNYSFIIYSL